MVDNMLLRKSLRDMKRSISQFISIFIMSMLAVIVITGLDTIWATLDKQSREIYTTVSASDLWITVSNPSERDMWKIRQVKGVKDAERRLFDSAKVNLDGDPVLTVYAAPPSNTLDQPFITKKMNMRSTGAVLDQKFATAHNLELGDKIKIRLNDYWLQYEIIGFGINAEHISAVEDIMPNHFKYGIIMVDIESVKDAYYDSVYYNQIQIRLNENVKADDIRQQIEMALGKKILAIQTHKDNPSFTSLSTQINQFKVLARVFPIMFLVVTALITLSTMARLVEEQRNQIGIMKALGYSKKAIMWHYTSYGIYIGVLGTVFGCILGPNTITRALMPDLATMFTLHSYQMVMYWYHVIIISIIIIMCTGGISAYSCYQQLYEMPANLLRTKPPKKGNHIFLERVNCIWKKMKFSQRLISRNLVRNKLRFFMSAFGIMGCMGLILGAFSLRQTLLETVSYTYGSVYTYDEKFDLDGKTSDYFCRSLQINGQKQTVQQTTMSVRNDQGYHRMVNVNVTASNSPLLHLFDEKDRNEIKLPDDGIILTRKQAELMNTKVGDRIFLKRTDKNYIPVEVADIVVMKEGQGIYISKEYFERLGEVYVPTTLLVKWNGERDLSVDSFANSNHVSKHITMLQQKEDFKTSLSIITVAVTLLISFGAILAFVVIYNMGMLNFFERIRDLSTLKVLGFYDKEIRALVLADNLLSAAFGIIFGIPLGKLVNDIILAYMGDYFDLLQDIKPGNVLLSVVLTVFFTVMVNQYLAKRMKKIDMLQALKSVE